MTTPATASTGITAFTPMSGTSPTVRMMPAPKPLMPLTVAATTASAATAASVGPSSSNLVLRHRPWPPVAIDGDVSERRLGDLHDFGLFGTALGVDLDVHRDRGRADAHQIDVKGNQVADLHRLLEHELVDRDGRHAAAREPARGRAAGDVDLRHDPAAEDVAVLVRVRGHRHHPQRRDLPFRELFHASLYSEAARRGTGRSPCRR